MSNDASSTTVSVGSVWGINNSSARAVVTEVDDTFVRFVRPLDYELHIHHCMYFTLFTRWYSWLSDYPDPELFPRGFDLEPIRVGETWTNRRKPDNAVEIVEVSDKTVVSKNLLLGKEMLPDSLNIWDFRHRFRRGTG